MRMCPVFRLPAYTKDDIEKHCLRRLHLYQNSGEISAKTYQSIFSFIQDYVLNEELLGQKTYSEQITLLNHAWWQKLFPE